MEKSNLSKAIDMIEQVLDPNSPVNLAGMTTDGKIMVLAPLILEMAKVMEKMQAEGKDKN